MPDIKLLRTHTHAGQPHAAGDVINVDPATADWLTTHGVGTPVTHQPPKSAAAEAGEPASALDRAINYFKPHHADPDTHGDDHEH